MHCRSYSLGRTLPISSSCPDPSGPRICARKLFEFKIGHCCYRTSVAVSMLCCFHTRMICFGALLGCIVSITCQLKMLLIGCVSVSAQFTGTPNATKQQGMSDHLPKEMDQLESCVNMRNPYYLTCHWQNQAFTYESYSKNCRTMHWVDASTIWPRNHASHRNDPSGD